MLKRLTPDVMVEDVARSAAFYTEVLGFQLVGRAPEEGETIDWAMLQRDAVVMMLEHRQSFAGDDLGGADQPIGGSLVFYIDVAGVEQLYETLKGRVKIVVDLHDAWYGRREFAFKDLDGYVLVFAEDVPSADAKGE